MMSTSTIENKDKSVQDESTDKIKIVTKPAEDARMQKGDIDYMDEYERQFLSARQQAGQQMEQARQEFENLRKNFRF